MSDVRFINACSIFTASVIVHSPAFMSTLDENIKYIYIKSIDERWGVCNSRVSRVK